MLTILLFVLTLVLLLYIEQTQIYFRLIRVLLIIISIGSVTYFLHLVSSSTKSEFSKKLFVSLYSIVFILLVCELIFMFIAKSEAIGITKASQIWYERYWHENSIHFRDREPVNKDTELDIFFIGDSYTAGAGIENVQDRFSDIFKNYLVSNYPNAQIYNNGYEGIDTEMEYNYGLVDFISKTKINPEFIVLQYYGNDIEQKAMKKGYKFPDPESFFFKGLNPIIVRLLNGSYLCNYLFWNNTTRFEKAFENYWGVIESAYEDEDLLNEHLSDIQQFIDYCRKNDVKIIVVIIPFLHDLEFSNRCFIDKLASWLNKSNTEFIDLGQLISDIPLQRRIVNMKNNHASREVHEILGKQIYTRVLKDMKSKSYIQK